MITGAYFIRGWTASRLQGTLPAISLPSQTALLSAFANDADPDMIYAQMVFGYGRPADLLYRKPTGFRATMVGYPYDDLAGWTGRFTPEILEEQFKELSELWGKGLEILQTLPDSAFEKGSAVRELWDSAEAAYCHFRSTFLQIRFVRIRDGLCPGDADEIRAIAKEEASLALRLAAVQRGNPCIGYESSNHYFYHTQLLAEKYLNCRDREDRPL